MRILFLNWKDRFHPAAGGAEEYTFQIGRRLVSRGHEVSWFSAAWPGAPQRQDDYGIQIRRAGNRLTVFLKARRYVRTLPREDVPDVIIDEVNTRPFFACEFALSGTRVCNIVHQLARDVWFQEVPFPVSLLGRYILEDSWLRRISALPTITVSESTKRDLELLGFRDVVIIRTGLEAGVIRHEVKKLTPLQMVFLGRLTKGKKPRDALDAFRIIRRRVPCLMTVIGDGPERAKLEHDFPYVRFLGHVDASVRDDVLAESAILLLPGTREGWGRVALEAQAKGVVPVAYSIPGLVDAIANGSAGILAQSNDARGLAEGALKLLDDPPLLRSMSGACEAWSRGFSWDRSSLEFESTLARLM
jgi:glycosyltransferase involved in cell wall biosynthesis